MNCKGFEVDATRSHYPTSRNALLKAGLIIVDEEKAPPFVWIDGILSKEEALDHKPYQRINKIPGMDYICYKSTLFKNLNEFRKLYPRLYDIYPKSYLLPQEFLEFQREHMTICGRMNQAPAWVIKPRNSCCGKGIQILQSVHEVQAITDPSVAQLYVHPFLVDGKKFDFRFYLLIASLDPLTIFIYKEGITRFCSEPYQPPSKANRADPFVHLTNTAINVQNGGVDPENFTRLASETLSKIEATGGSRGATLWNRIKEVSRAVIIGIYPAILQGLPKPSDKKYSPYLYCSNFHHNKFNDLIPEQENMPDLEKSYDSEEGKHDLCEVMEETQFEDESRILKSQQQNNSSNNLEDNKTPKIRIIASPVTRSPNKYMHFIPKHSAPAVLKKQTNMVILPSLKQKNKSPSPDPIIVGSIVNYQITQSSDTKPLIIPKSSHRSNSLSPKKSIKPPTQTLGERRSPFKKIILLRNEKKDKINENASEIPKKDCMDKNGTDQKNSTDKNPNTDDQSQQVRKKSLRPRQKYFHVLGIDIIIDSDLEPQVLELNDRPSLGVTVSFEQELKEGLLAEEFEHVFPDGSVRGNVSSSKWEQIYPMEQDEPNSGIWSEIVNHIVHPNTPIPQMALPPKKPTGQKTELKKGDSKFGKKKTKKH